MEIEITNKRENAVLKRTEVYFRVEHPKEKTPKRDAVKGKIAEALKTNRDLVVIDYLKSEYGMPVTTGYAKAYRTVDDLKKVEREYIQKRNKMLKDEGEKKEGGAE